MYLHLFHAITNALSMLELEQEQRARAILIDGQRGAEEIYMDWKMMKVERKKD